jgi:hypothetical protein
VSPTGKKRRGPADVLLAGEASLLLAFFRVCLAVVSVRRILRVLTHGSAGEPVAEPPEAQDADLELARRVQWAVRAVARHSPVQFVCFPQTLAAYTMLRRRGVAGSIVYGVKRSAEGELLAHTWLEACGGCVVGGEERGGFSVLDRWS